MPLVGVPERAAPLCPACRAGRLGTPRAHAPCPVGWVGRLRRAVRASGAGCGGGRRARSRRVHADEPGGRVTPHRRRDCGAGRSRTAAGAPARPAPPSPPWPPDPPRRPGDGARPSAEDAGCAPRPRPGAAPAHRDPGRRRGALSGRGGAERTAPGAATQRAAPPHARSPARSPLLRAEPLNRSPSPQIPKAYSPFPSPQPQPAVSPKPPPTAPPAAPVAPQRAGGLMVPRSSGLGGVSSSRAHQVPRG